MNLQIINADCLEALGKLESGSVHCCTTSPPYWGLRKYGDWRMQCVWGKASAFATPHHPEKAKHHVTLLKMRADRKGIVWARNKKSHICAYGLEPTPDLYVQHTVKIFREVRRVLRDDSTLWLNLGDSFAGGGNNRGNQSPLNGKQASNGGAVGQVGAMPIPPGLKPKDLCGIPWMVAFALRADGWYLRQAAPWVKRNSMPESCQDRPATSIEMIFLLTKSATYFYDAEAVKLPGSMALLKQVKEGYNGKATKDFASSGAQDASAVKSRIISGKREKQRGHSRRHNGFNDRWDEMEKEEQCSGWRSCRNSDWFFESIGGMLLDEDFSPLAFVVNPQGSPESHFATFPPKLIAPMILAGTSARGCCPKCGAPWERIVENTGGTWEERKSNGSPMRYGTENIETLSQTRVGQSVSKTLGWQPTCDCGESSVLPCTVLDPFGGSGTTGQVAIELARKAVLIELNPKYIPLIEARTNVTPGLPF